MNPNATVESLEREMRAELVRRILPFWSRRAVDNASGGFIGYMGPDGRVDPDVPRGGILNARVLWAFAAAHRVLGAGPGAGPDRVGGPHGPSATGPGALPLAAMVERAAATFTGRFIDPEHGGVYWMVGRDGRPTDDRKHVYAQAFGIYALAEHHRATGDEGSGRLATTLFEQVERCAPDEEHGGYREAFARDWTPLRDVRLSDRDLDAPRSANTHLHLLEAYTTLYRARPDGAPDPAVAGRLRALVELFLDHIVDGDAGHVLPFFDRDWTVRSRAVSFGHDIETAWLLADAAAALGDPGLEARARGTALLLADTVLAEGLDREHGGVFYEARDGQVDRAKEWWTQAEAVVGFLHAYQETARRAFLDAAWSAWVVNKGHLLDRESGEWHRRTDRGGTPRPGTEIIGPWKGPYHNTRACLEVATRSRKLLAAGRPWVW